MALAQAKLDQLSARIAGLHFPSTGWQGRVRGEALERLTAMGVPGRRDEYWRYTDPTLLTAAEPKPVEVDYLAECEKTLTRCLGRGVKIVSGKRKGKIELEYYGQEDLQRLYEALSGSLGKEQP